MSMKKIMGRDDKLDALDDDAIKDLWVRYDLMNAVQKYGTARMAHDSEDTVSNQTAEGVRTWVIECDVFAGRMEEIARETEGDGFIAEMWEYRTKEDATADMARGKLKKILRGCMGMPRDAVIRDGIRRHEAREKDEEEGTDEEELCTDGGQKQTGLTEYTSE